MASNMRVVPAVLLLLVVVDISIVNILCDVAFESTDDSNIMLLRNSALNVHKGVKKKISHQSSNDPTGWRLAEVQHDNKFINPTGWNYDRVTKSSQRNDDNKNIVQFCNNLLTTENSKDIITSNFQKETASFNYNVGESRGSNVVFVRRFVNLLLEAADLPNKFKNNENDAFGVIEVRLTLEQYKTLTRFSESEENISFPLLESVLSKSLYGRHETPFDIEKALFILSQKEYWLPILILIVVIYFIRLIANSKTRSVLLRNVLLLIFTSSYLIEYYRMYKKVEIKQKTVFEKHKDIPKECLAENQSWWDAFFDSFAANFRTKKNDICQEYYTAILLDPLVEVSPLRVLSTLLADCVLAPASIIGDAIARFTTAVLGGLPVQYGLIVWIVWSTALFIIICLSLTLLSGHSLTVGNILASVSISRQLKDRTSERSVPQLTTNAPLPEYICGTTKYILVEESNLKKMLKAGPSNRIEELENLSPQTKNKKSEVEEEVIGKSQSEKSEEVDQDTPEETIQVISLDSSNKGLLCEVFEKCETVQLKIPHQETIDASSTSNVNITNLSEKDAGNKDLSEELTELVNTKETH